MSFWFKFYVWPRYCSARYCSAGNFLEHWMSFMIWMGHCRETSMAKSSPKLPSANFREGGDPNESVQDFVSGEKEQAPTLLQWCRFRQPRRGSPRPSNPSHHSGNRRNRPEPSGSSKQRPRRPTHQCHHPRFRVHLGNFRSKPTGCNSGSNHLLDGCDLTPVPFLAIFCRLK